MRDHNENKTVLPVLCYPSHYQFVVSTVAAIHIPIKIMIEIFCQKLIDHLKPKIFFGGRQRQPPPSTYVIVIISKSGQGKTYNEYEAGKNAS